MVNESFSASDFVVSCIFYIPFVVSTCSTCLTSWVVWFYFNWALNFYVIKTSSSSPASNPPGHCDTSIKFQILLGFLLHPEISNEVCHSGQVIINHLFVAGRDSVSDWYLSMIHLIILELPNASKIWKELSKHLQHFCSIITEDENIT